MSRIDAAPRTAVSVSNARAEASRRNGAKSRGPKTPEGKARSAQNALKHGLRAQKYIVLPEEDAAEFAGLEAAMIEELAPVGALQTVLARRVAIAAWRLARADRIEVELFEERGYGDAGPGLALIRDGNGTRSFETLLRYRGAAMAEFWRALKTLKALQAEQAADTGPALEARALAAHHNALATRPAARPPLVHRAQPDEPERNLEHRLEYVSTAPTARGRTLHEPAAPWLPNEPETGLGPHAASPLTQPRPERTRSAPRRATCPVGDPRHGFPGSHGPSEQMPNPWLKFR
jgi:hypothetical protein